MNNKQTRNIAICMASFKGCEIEVLMGFSQAAFRLGRDTEDRFAFFPAVRQRAERAANLSLQHMEDEEEKLGIKFSHIIWIDDDVVVNGDAILKLLDSIDSEHRVVASLSFERNGAYRPAIWKAHKWGGEAITIEQIFDYPEDDLIEIEASGLCCVAFDRTVFDEIKKPYFDWILKGYKQRGCSPDIYLFMKLNEAGIKCFCHTGIKVGHMSFPYIVDEAFALKHKDQWKHTANLPR